MKEKKEKYCGKCCWFYGEDSYGYGFCPHRFVEMNQSRDKCSMPAKFISIEQMRHYQAVLLQANRYRRDDNVPSIYKMPNPRELGKAIDFAVQYMKVFSDL